ncbi:MAG: hypothetical protein V1855_03865 [bacterium]
MSAKRQIVLGIVFLSGFSLQAVDLPVFYRAPLFQAFHDQRKDWATRVAVRYAQGQTRSGWNGAEDKTSFLDIYGPLDITKLGLGLEYSDNAPKTKEYWGSDTATLVKADNLEKLAENDGKLKLKGKLKVYDLSFTIKQSLFSGFYAQVYIPVRRVKIQGVSIENLGSKVLKDNAGKDFLNVDDFVAGKNGFADAGLPVVLKENGFSSFESFEKSIFKKTDIPSLLLSAGWQGEATESLGIIDSLRGFVQAGIIMPTSGRKNENELLALASGYNDFWGFNFQASAEVSWWKLVLGAHAGVNVFLPSERTIRMSSDQAQAGWIRLGKGQAKVDQAALWNVSGYAKIHQILGGLSVLVGYSYVQQEDTDLLVKDDTFLKSVVQTARAAAFPKFISKEHIVKSDPRFKNWNQQSLHALLEYDAQVHLKSWFAPVIRLEYAYPFIGKRSGAVDLFSGTLGFCATWNV